MDAVFASRLMHILVKDVLAVMDVAAWAKIAEGGGFAEGVDSLAQLEHIPNWRLLGAGHFSAVFEYDEYAIKLGFKKEDSGAMYAAYCRDNAGTQHLPEIIHIEQIDRFYCVVMPKYKPSSEIQWNDYDTRSDYEQHMREFFYGVELRNSSTFPQLTPTLKGIKGFFDGIAAFDLHRHNYMWCPKRGVIITDPVSFKRAAAIPTPTEVFPVTKTKAACVSPNCHLLSVGFNAAYARVPLVLTA